MGRKRKKMLMQLIKFLQLDEAIIKHFMNACIVNLFRMVVFRSSFLFFSLTFCDKSGRFFAPVGT